MVSKLLISPAREEDSRDIWLWRNDAVTRLMSRCQDEISWSEHQSWYSDALRNPGLTLLIGSHPITRQKIGLCRFDLNEAGTAATVSLNLNPANRGKGLSGEFLRAGIQFFDLRHCVELEAVIKSQNIPSIRCFETCGFFLLKADMDLLHYRLPVRLHPIAEFTD